LWYRPIMRSGRCSVIIQSAGSGTRQYRRLSAGMAIGHLACIGPELALLSPRFGIGFAGSTERETRGQFHGRTLAAST
jgi:hypothetical protein